MKEEKKKGSLFENTFLTEKSTFTILNNILKTIPTPPTSFFFYLIVNILKKSRCWGTYSKTLNLTHFSK